MTPRAQQQFPRLFLLGLFLGLATALQGQVTFYATKAAFDSVATTVLLETFESVPTTDTPLASLTSNGVTYQGFAGTPSPNIYVITAGATNFGVGVGATTSSVLTADGDEDFTATFSTAPTALGFDTYLNGLGAATVQVFNGAALLGTYSYDASVNTKQYLGIVSTTPITSIRWTSALGATRNTGIDNLSVGAIPEPAGFASMVSAMALIGAILGRRWLPRGLARRVGDGICGHPGVSNQQTCC